MNIAKIVAILTLSLSSLIASANTGSYSLPVTHGAAVSAKMAAPYKVRKKHVRHKRVKPPTQEDYENKTVKPNGKVVNMPKKKDAPKK